MNLNHDNQIDSLSYDLDVEGLIKQKFLESKFSNIKINLYEAFAGCGKTQHLKEIVKKNAEQGKNNFLFLAFNKSIRLELIEDVKYPYFNRRNTHTFHSFACSFLNRAERETFKDQEDQQEFFKSLINDFRCADFQNNELSNKYDIIIVDELQDLSDELLAMFFKILKENLKAQIFIAGDRFQSIYQNKILSNFDILDRYFNNIQKKVLNTCYRLPTDIQLFINQYFKKHYKENIPFYDLNGKEVSSSNNLLFYSYLNFQEIKTHLEKHLRRYEFSNKRVAVLYRNHLHGDLLKNHYADKYPNVDFLSYHSSKGKTYDIVILILSSISLDGEEVYLEKEQEKNLFYVALSRVKEKLIIASFLAEEHSNFLFDLKDLNLHNQKVLEKKEESKTFYESLKIRNVGQYSKMMDSLILSFNRNDCPYLTFHKQKVLKKLFMHSDCVTLLGYSFFVHRGANDYLHYILFDFKDLNEMHKNGLNDIQIIYQIFHIISSYFSYQVSFFAVNPINP